MTTILLLCAFVLVVAYALNHITFNLKYNEIGMQVAFEGGNHAIFVNPKALGFVRYYLIPSKVPVILNWNIGSTVSDQVCENDVEHKQINTFKCLVNGEISLSWNTNNVLKLD